MLSSFAVYKCRKQSSAMWYFEEVLWHFNLILHEGGGGGGIAGESVQEKIFV